MRAAVPTLPPATHTLATRTSVYAMAAAAAEGGPTDDELKGQLEGLVDDINHVLGVPDTEVRQSFHGAMTHISGKAEGGRREILAHTFSFTEAMSTADRDELFTELLKSGIDGQLVCGLMLKILQLGLTDDDHARCSTKDPGPAYYMLCEEEELGTNDDGSTDGDPKIRRAAGMWTLWCGAAGGFYVAELHGYEGEELVAGGTTACRVADGDVSWVRVLERIEAGQRIFPHPRLRDAVNAFSEALGEE